MERLQDPKILALPHPVRMDAALGHAFDTEVFANLGLLEDLRPSLTDESVTTEWLINALPGLNALALVHLGMPASVNMGTFILMLTRARLRAHGDPILAVTPALQALLAETDLVSGLPARFFRCPHPLAYIAFPRPSDLRVPNQVSGLHELEGVYVGTYSVPPHHALHHKDGRNRALQLDPDKPTRVVELVLTGSPVGKKNALDDASQDLVLFIQDEDECLSTLLERHLTYFQRPEIYEVPGMRPANPEEVQLVRPMVLALAKVLLYLNLADAEQARIDERDALERKYRRYGKLTAARRAKLEATYNRTLLGPNSVPDAGAGATLHARDEAKNRIRPHWKRGHFKRIRFGERLSQSRLQWIQPYLVHKAEVFATVKTRASAER
ncbi:hypothetical protein F2Q65_14885 [Thiohalocapsa marina]|uniref:Uncharacterized protein n=1 Tax=Thiohalocapsa marina TaxID=424902 RepID=A0A5M8FRA5_9GAMM|nr:hypothetical protein [Thiohalocapsa marina]KAA6183722.1 hypothetical protein F2Q65_14885 [Thiohalocapsa marina]